MTLIYKFKKEKLESGGYVIRPRILVELIGSKGSVIVPALIDSGCDTTVIPEGIARGIGLSIEGDKHKLYAYRECNDVVESSVNINFLGKEYRQSVTLSNLRILVALSKESVKEEEDIVLGIEGVFDAFEIIFKKSQNRIIFKPVSKVFYRKNETF